MNITFTINVHDFDKASKIEATLKTEDIPYCVKVDDKPSTEVSKAQRKKRISKAELLAATNCISKNPEWNDKELAKACNISRATIGRIRQGIHTLQKGNLKLISDEV